MRDIDSQSTMSLGLSAKLALASTYSSENLAGLSPDQSKGFFYRKKSGGSWTLVEAEV